MRNHQALKMVQILYQKPSAEPSDYQVLKMVHFLLKRGTTQHWKWYKIYQRASTETWDKQASKMVDVVPKKKKTLYWNVGEESN